MGSPSGIGTTSTGPSALFVFFLSLFSAALNIWEPILGKWPAVQSAAVPVAVAELSV